MRKFQQEFTLPKICFGGNVFGWTVDEKTAFHLLDSMLDQGINFIDTANNYSYWAPNNVGGESEIVLGKWFKATRKRHQVILSTKVGGSMQGVERGLSRTQIIKAVDASLTRLKTDYIDLYYTHHDDLNTPLEEVMRTYNELIQQGKVRYLGASNMAADRIVESNIIAKQKEWQGYEALQPLYNLYDREKYETEYLALVEQNNWSVMPYFALASGFLTGKYRSLEDIENSSRKDFVKKYINERGLTIIDECGRIAKTYGASITEVALAWLLQQSTISAPIVSATNMMQLQSLIKATQLILTAEDVKELNKASTW